MSSTAWKINGGSVAKDSEPSYLKGFNATERLNTECNKLKLMKNCHFTVSFHRSRADMLVFVTAFQRPAFAESAQFFYASPQTCGERRSAHAVPLTFPPLLTTRALEYSTELSKAPLHYWTLWIFKLHTKALLQGSILFSPSSTTSSCAQFRPSIIHQPWAHVW